MKLFDFAQVWINLRPKCIIVSTWEISYITVFFALISVQNLLPSVISFAYLSVLFVAWKLADRVITGLQKLGIGDREIQGSDENLKNKSDKHESQKVKESAQTAELLLLHPFNGPFSTTTWVSWPQKSKPIWILLEQEMIRWQCLQLDHMQIICTSLQTDNHTSNSPFSFFTGWLSFPLLNQHASSIEGNGSTAEVACRQF